MFIETICILNGKVQNIEAHKKRMQETAYYHGFKAPKLPNIEELLNDDIMEGKVKCRMRYYNDISSISFEKYVTRSINTLKLVSASPNYAFKFSDRSAIEDILKLKNGCDEILIVRNGLITDTSYSNVVFSKNEFFFTPSHPILNGTKRQKLLKDGIVEETQIDVDSIKEYDRVWLINALLDIEDEVSLPVENIY